MITCCSKRRILNALLLTIATATMFFLAGCQGLGSSPTPTPTPAPTPGSLNSINHIVLFMQENRSFDHYFGQINLYRASQGLPQEVETWGPNKTPAGIQTPSYDPVTGQPGPPIAAFHMPSACSENLTPSWNESHRMMNFKNPASTSGFDMNGFAFVEGKFAHDEFLSGAPNFTDFTGKRAMGYYDQNDLPFYYFMATNFAMSDHFFSPVPTRTTPNRMYWLAATSQGWIIPPTQQVPAKTIFEAMDNAHISWKIYLAGKSSYYFIFPYSNTHRTNVVPVSEYFTDVQNGTLPQVAYIETGVEGANGETPSAVDEHPNDNIQVGAQFSEKLITALMNSQSWKDSVFVQTYDEGGGLYDHVPPISVPNPDGIPPMLVTPNGVPHTQGDFTISGFRVPMFVVSPFAKKNFVSHTPMDATSVLKFIEMRFNLPSLTQRDASMPGLNEFFDFSTATGPWATPPTPPHQPTNMPCTFGVPQG
jgi:phospholipase C